MLLIVVAVVVILLYLYGTRTFGYWAKRGVKHDPPIPFFGNAARQLFQKISYANIYDEMYWKYPNERFVGYYFTTTPMLILRDPELIKHMLVSDFISFYSRSVHPLDEKPEMLLNNLFACEGDLWKLLRQRMTPAFTSGKLKAMFPLIMSRAEKLQQLAAEAASSGTDVDVRDLMARYTTDFIGACGFGIDTDTLNDENSLFRQIGRRLFNTTTRDAVVLLLKFMMPGVFKSFHFFPDFVEKNVLELVKKIMVQRNHKPSGRNDFIDLLLELKQNGKITGDSLTKKNPDGSPVVAELEFDDIIMTAQVIVFFAAGFETSSSATSYMLHELAYHPEIQEKCQAEIDAVLSRHDNKLSYEAVKEMKYLNMCFSETLRVFPSLGYLMRKCEKAYTIPDTSITIDPGVKILVPVKSLHVDPRFWDEPERFDPERFHPDNAAKIPKHVYLPFGEGPRNCIGWLRIEEVIIRYHLFIDVYSKRVIITALYFGSTIVSNMLLIVVAVVVILLYLYGTRTFGYWAKRGVKHDPPIPFFGNAARQLFQKISYADIYDEMYWKYPNERFVGYYCTTTPMLILRDPELIKHMLVSDFVSFYSRSVHPLDEKPEMLLNNLFSCEGDLWKLLRQRMTPAFTSGKLKAMFPLIVSRAEKLQQLAAEAASSGTDVDVRDLMARYTTDFIGACGFGIDTDTLSDENSLFRQIGRRLFNTTTRDAVVLLLKFMMPGMFKSFHFFPEFVEINMLELVKKIMVQRNHKPSGRNDFIDLLLELKQNGKITGDSLTKKNPDGSPVVVELELDDIIMTAQVIVFFAAGFETSSSATSYMLHELAYHPEIQEKCQAEIDAVLSRYDNKLSYEAVKEMKYLNMCFSETLRVFPSLGYLMRKCEKAYTIPDTSITIDPGVKILVPVKSLHVDPRFWDEPERFDPERFHPDNAAKIPKHVYLPFGEGPRNCIGERLGNMQSLAGVAALLSQFTMVPGKTTVRRPPVDPKVYIVQSIRGGLPLAMVHRKKRE